MVISTIPNPTTTDREDVRNKALLQLWRRNTAYRTYRNYYDGKQPLTFASDRYRTAFARMVSQYTENMMPAVVDAIADRLIVVGFEVEGADADAAGPAVWDLWRTNRMDMRAGEVHQEASREGDAYVIVWPDEATGQPRIIPQSADMMTVHYDEETEAIDWAAKWWILDDKKGRLNIYWPDRIEKYQTRNVVQGSYSTKGGDLELIDEVTNPYGRVPVFHFANNAGVASFGQSDLRDVIPIQDALNKSVADLLVSMEFAAFAQRWATGLEINVGPDGKPKAPFEAGIDRIWATDGENVKFGEFAAADLSQIIAVHDMFLTSISRVTGVPTHYLILNPTSWPSGESLKTAEARFVAKVRDRQISWGNCWEDVLVFAAEIAGIDINGRLSAMWQDASPRSDRDMAEVANLKKPVGVSDEQIQRELGYSEEQIGQMKSEREASAVSSLERNMQLLNHGGLEDE